MNRPTLSAVLGLSLAAVPAGSLRAQSAHPQHAAAGAPAALRFAYSPGRHAVYSTRTVQTAPAPAGATTITGRLEMDVLSVQPNGSAQMRMRLASIDVSNPAVTPAIQAQIAQGITGLAIQYSQDTRGQTADRQAPASSPPEMRALVDGLLQALDQLSPLLPEQPVAIGGTWHSRHTTHIPATPTIQIDVTVDTTYTLRDLRTSAAGRIAVLGLAMTMAIGNVTVNNSTVGGAGNATGEATVDLAQGILTDSHSTGSMTLHVTAQGRSADMPITETNEMRLATTP